MDNYILAYYQAMTDGSVTVGRWIRMWYEKLIREMQDGRIFFDQKKANRAIRFIEGFCRHHEGALAPQLIRLELWEKAAVSVLFGITDETGARQFREAVIVIARKNGKTLLAAAIAAYCAFMDGEYGGRIYMAAPKLQQASLCFEATKQMIDKEPELSELAKRRRSDIYIEQSNSSIAPLAFSAKKSDGLNISLCICDEIASWQGDAGLKMYEVLKSSFGARRQPLMLSITTAGYINDSIYDELIKRCTAVLLGNSGETRLAPFLYTIDDIEKWNDLNELRKSNPNLGVSVTVDYLLEEIAIAEGSISKRSEFLTKYCNVKQSSAVAWLRYEDIEAAMGEPIDLTAFRECYCVGGIDLSQTTDLTACAAVIERGGLFYAVAQFFMPAQRLETAMAEDGVPYDAWVKRGLLTLSGDNCVDYHDCYNWFTKLVEKYHIYPLKIGYDRYSAQYLVQDMKNYGFHMDDVFQGWNLTSVVRDTEGIVRDRRFRFGDNAMLQMCFLNTALKVDQEGKRVTPVKVGKRTRIDGAMAVLDAMTVRSKYYDEIGRQLANDKRGG